MGTRSVIIVSGLKRFSEKKSFRRLYKHWDGYPLGALPVLLTAVKESTRLLSLETETKYQTTDVDVFCKLIEYGDLSCNSTGARVEAKSNSVFEIFGNQSDLEFVYVIDITRKWIFVFGSGIGDVEHHIKSGSIDLEKYFKQSYKNSNALAEFQKIKTSLEDHQWELNPLNVKPLEHSFPRMEVIQHG